MKPDQVEKPNLPIRFDSAFIGCAYCRQPATDRWPLMFSLPPGFVSLDARDNARLHEHCYWAFVNHVRTFFNLLPLTPDGHIGKGW